MIIIPRYVTKDDSRRPKKVSVGVEQEPCKKKNEEEEGVVEEEEDTVVVAMMKATIRVRQERRIHA